MAGVMTTVDPAERYRTEMQKAYTDKNLKRLIQKTTGNSSDTLALQDRDFMEYTATLNAQER